MFNIFAQLHEELNSFFQEKVHIAGIESGDGAKYLKNQTKGYQFSQWETLNRIDMMTNSRFESGEIDSEGQQKVFLNVCKFRADVAAKQTDMDVKDFVFEPLDLHSFRGAFFMNKKFRSWAKDNDLGQLINDVNIDYSKYGSAVIKKVGQKLERVPLRSLRNEQGAKSLKTARFVIEEHPDMTREEMEDMNWNVSGLDMKFTDTEIVYERYGRVPLSFYNKYKGLESSEGDENKAVDCMAILVLREDKQNKLYGGAILFLEKIKERPYEEAHWSRQDGRWLGIGEIENQFENQVFRNMTANMLRRSLLWGSKKIFQSADENVAKNLVRDVKDGDVMKIMNNGQISQVNMASNNLAEYQLADQVWEKNSDQKSFTYEVATGEALPSGTPFRLGVVLSNAVSTHFGLKRENLGLFFGRVVDNLLMPIFKKDNKRSHTLLFSADEEGIEELKQELIEIETIRIVSEQLFGGSLPDYALVKQSVTEQLNQKKVFSVDVSENFYDYIEATTTLVTTGENMNIEKRAETLTNIYNSMVQRGDLRADSILKKAIGLTGENTDFLTGSSSQQVPMQGAMQAFSQPQMATV